MIKFEWNRLVNELESISYTIPTDTIDCAQLSIKINNELFDGLPKNTTHCVNVSKTDISILLNELKTIKRLMDDMDYNKRYPNNNTTNNVATNGAA